MMIRFGLKMCRQLSELHSADISADRSKHVVFEGFIVYACLCVTWPES